MPANVTVREDGKAEMMFVGKTPWHGMGQYVGDKEVTSAEAVVAAGMDFKAVKKPLTYLFQGERKATDAFAIVREDNGRHLGTVGSKYEPFQYAQAFEFFDGVVGGKHAIYHTAGTLSGGRIGWILAKMNNVLKIAGDDVVEKFLLLKTGHDGNSAVEILFTPIRVVCANTLSAAFDNVAKGDVFRMKHTRNIGQKVFDVQNHLASVDAYFKKFNEAAQFLAGEQATKSDVENFLIQLELARANQREGMNPKRLVYESADCQKVISLFERGRGNDMNGIKGSFWSLYNSVTEFVDHERKTRCASKSGDSSNACRLKSAWFGSGADLKQEAFTLALDMAGKK